MMKIGVVGGGVVGCMRARSVIEDPETELVAVFDLAEAAGKAAAAGSTARVTTSLEAFLDCEMDAAIVSTPPKYHEEACVGAFQRGRHVICEKPLSNTVEGGRRIVEAALAHDRVLGVGFNLRYYPYVKFVKAALDSGQIGTMDHVRVFGGHDGLHNFRADWQYKCPDSGGGAMMDIGIHMTDLARYVLGEITSIYGHMSESVFKVPGSEDNAMVVMKSPDGIAAIYQTTWTEWKGYKTYIEVYGDKGMVRGSYAPMQNLLITKDSPSGSATTQRKFYPSIIVREKLRTWTSTALLSFKEELRDFRRMIAGDYDVPLADGFAGLRAIEIAQAVRDSTSTGNPVELPILGRMNR
jgi:predicted dehydrogenase